MALSAAGRTAAMLGCAVALIMALFVWQVARPRGLSDAQLQAMGVVMLSPPRPLAEFLLHDQHGRPFGRERLAGRWTLFFPAFTNCPDICPQTFAILGRSWRRMDGEARAAWQVAMISVDPGRDDAQRLAAFVGHFSADFLALRTDDPAQLYGFATRQLNILYQARALGDSYTMDHSANLVVTDRRGRYAAFIRPPFDPDELAAIMEALARR